MSPISLSSPPNVTTGAGNSEIASGFNMHLFYIGNLTAWFDIPNEKSSSLPISNYCTWRVPIKRSCQALLNETLLTNQQCLSQDIDHHK